MRLYTMMSTSILVAGLLAGCGGSGGEDNNNGGNNDRELTLSLSKVQQLLETNADIAYAVYSDSYDTAVELQSAIAAFADNPSEENLSAAKKAWLVAREPYGQSEVYRFRLSPIDSTNYADEDGPEGDINAWPLGEGLIDYVVMNDSDFGEGQVGVSNHGTGVDYPAENIINSNVTIDASLLANSATAEDERDVISGYHAIEFMLWGQDLNNSGGATIGNDRDLAVKTFGAGNIALGGQRPLADFILDSEDEEANRQAARRHQYLAVVAQKLVDDLKSVVDGWAPNVEGNYRDQFTSVASRQEAVQKLAEILTGMGTLSESELAGDRVQIPFSTNSQEDEHSCFSDNTHRDIWLDAEGVANSYYGRYAGYDSNLDGIDDVTTRAVMDGYGFDELLTDLEMVSLKNEIESALTDTENNYKAIDAAARSGSPVDVLIMDSSKDPDNPTQNPMYNTILSLNAQAVKIANLTTELSVLEDVLE